MPEDIKKQMRERTVGYITAALGLVAGLAWNDAVKSLIDYFYADSSSILAKFIYALIVTAVVVLISYLLINWIGKDEEK